MHTVQHLDLIAIASINLERRSELACHTVVFHRYGSLGNILTSDVVEDAGSNLTSNVFFVEKRLRACVPETHVSLVLQVLKRSGYVVGSRTAVYGGSTVPSKISHQSEEGAVL